MRNRISLILGSLALLTIAHADQFTITVTNYGPQPLSPLFFAASDSTYNLFNTGSQASLGIKKIAEGGDTSAALADAAAQSSKLGAYGVVGGAPLAPGLTSTYTFNTDSAHGNFSFAAMLGKTNDGFIGESVSSKGLNLYSAGAATGFTYDIFGDRAWDAGTEKNTQNAADLGFLGGHGNPAEDAGNNFIRVHGGVLAGVGDSWSQMPSWNTNAHLARVSVQATPEPTTMAFLTAGIGMVIKRRKKQG